MVYTYKYARPALTADCVVFALGDKRLKVLLIQRAHEPFKGQWALPGGFADVGESLENTARRELEEETGLQDVFLEQLHTFSEPDRDPREHVVTVAFYALVSPDGQVTAGSDARQAAWFGIDDIPQLAFDHNKILQVACEQLRVKVVKMPIVFELLPEKFPLRMLQQAYEMILNRPLDKRNFRKKILSMGLLEELTESETGVSHRAARLYRLNKGAYDRKVEACCSDEIMGGCHETTGSQ